MRLTREQKRYLKITRWLMLAALILAPTYTMLADGFSSWYPYVNTFICAQLIVFILVFFEFIVFTGRVRKKKFLVILLLKIAAYSMTIVFSVLSVLIFTRMLKFDVSIPSVISSDEFQNFLKYGDFKVSMAYAFGLIILTNFVLQMNRKMGQGVLFGFITGKFRIPTEKHGFVMFLKLNASDKIIRSLGNVQFLEFFNEVIFDMTNNFIFRKGIISSYIDDEILITWEVKNGAQDANALRMYFEMNEKIDLLKVNYFEKYGVVPSFAGALHFGKIVTGEIGEVKSEVRHHGDSVNTAHRILGYTTDENSFIVSDPALQQIELPGLYKSRIIGPVQIRGKENSLVLNSIREI
jgi:adenylate cyclase